MLFTRILYSIMGYTIGVDATTLRALRRRGSIVGRLWRHVPGISDAARLARVRERRSRHFRRCDRRLRSTRRKHALAGAFGYLVAGIKRVFGGSARMILVRALAVSVGYRAVLTTTTASVIFALVRWASNH